MEEVFEVGWIFIIPVAGFFAAVLTDKELASGIASVIATIFKRS